MIMQAFKRIDPRQALATILGAGVDGERREIGHMTILTQA